MRTRLVLLRVARSHAARLALIAAVAAAGCEKDYGRGVLLTLIAPIEAMGQPAGRLHLTVFGDGSETRNDDFTRPGGALFFDGRDRETILYKAGKDAIQIDLHIRAFWGDVQALPRVESNTIKLEERTVRREWQLVMAGPDADLAIVPPADMAVGGADGSPKDMAKTPTDFTGAPDGSDLNETSTDMAQCGDAGMCSVACNDHCTFCEGGPDRHVWTDCDGTNSNAALVACRLYQQDYGGSCWNTNETCASVPGHSCRVWQDGNDFTTQRRWCTDGKIYSLGTCSGVLGSWM